MYYQEERLKMTRYVRCHIKLNKRGRRGKHFQPIQFLWFDEWTKFVLSSCHGLCLFLSCVYVSVNFSKNNRPVHLKYISRIRFSILNTVWIDRAIETYKFSLQSLKESCELVFGTTAITIIYLEEYDEIQASSLKSL